MITKSNFDAVNDDELSDESTDIFYPLSIDKIPSSIKSRAFSMLFLSLIFVAVIIAAHFLFPDFYFIKMLLAVLIWALFAAVKAFIVIKGTMEYGYLKLSGSVVNIYPQKFDKKTYYIQMHDEIRDVYISFKYSGGKAITPGNPVTLYLSPTETIKTDDELGNFVESYLSVIFSAGDIIEGDNQSRNAGDILSKSAKSTKL